ncbi:MBL fold metallo-hydrolase [Thalassotalea fusca]
MNRAIAVTCLVGLPILFFLILWTNSHTDMFNFGHKFTNRYGVPSVHKGQWAYIKMRLFESRFPDFPDDGLTAKVVKPDLLPPDGGLKATWIGHSSVLLQSKDVNIITDPVFSTRASFVSWLGPKRYSPPAVALEDLPAIDIAVISHNHYDHLDSRVVEAWGNQTHWVVPLGLKRWFEAQGVTNVTELDWFHGAKVKGVYIQALPAQHWSGRHLFDTNRTLWASYQIKFKQHNVWFGGDTGYNESLFKEIAKEIGEVDLALIPIGGYGPESFMRSKHCSPEEAVKIHQHIQARRSIAIHWGTFILTSEPVNEPPQRLFQAVKEAGLPENAFRAFHIGGQVQVNHKPRTESVIRKATHGEN